MQFVNNNELIQQRFRQMYSRDFERMEAEAKEREEENNIGKSEEVTKADEPSVGQAKDDEEYKKLVNKLLNKYGVDEIKDLTEKQKKNFFSELDEAHTSEKEMKKSDKKIEKSFLILGVNNYISSIENKTEDTMKTEQNDIDIEKGVYKDNPKNRKLGRVGQKYGGEGKKDDKGGKEESYSSAKKRAENEVKHLETKVKEEENPKRKQKLEAALKDAKDKLEYYKKQDK